MKAIPFYLLLALLFVQTALSAPACTVCANCLNCGQDVLADGYLDEINALMQAKVQGLGYPLTIDRNATAAAITYNIQYSSGLLVLLELTLSNMQIQLLSYSVNNAITPTTAPPAPPAPAYQTTPDGYFVLDNFGSSA
jgi:hypothetical protein